MDKKGHTLTLEEWKDLGRQISELLDLTWKCAQAKAEIKTLELRSWYIDKVEMFAETGEMYWELDETLLQLAKQLKPPLDRHTVWKGIQPYIEPKLQEAYEKTFKEHRGRGFDKVAKILQHVEKLGFPKEAKEGIPKKLKKES